MTSWPAIDTPQPAKHSSPNPPERLGLAGVFFDALAHLPAQPMARVARGAAVDGAAADPVVVASDVGRDVALAARYEQVGRVAGLVGAEATVARPPRQGVEHRRRGAALAAGRGLPWFVRPQ